MVNQTLKKQVCTIEQAEKLCSLGFMQKSLFWRYKYNSEIYTLQEPITFPKASCIFSAYTETELKAFFPYQKAGEEISIFELADKLIDLVENEITFTVDECNLNYLEFFNIDETHFES